MRYRRLKYIIFSITAILIISISSSSNYFHNSPFDHNKNDENNNFDQVEDIKSPENPKSATSEPSGIFIFINRNFL